jgi:hypothetical protein
MIWPGFRDDLAGPHLSGARYLRDLAGLVRHDGSTVTAAMELPP